MATTTMNRTVATKQPQKPSETPKVYDPVKTAEGMFNGCVSRIALALRDPKNYGEYTPYIIAESSKLFHDALDDLTLQVLDVKWLLERKLAQNRARRESERKTKESATAVSITPGKRKLDEIEPSPETPSKRLKNGDQKSPRPNETESNEDSKTAASPAPPKATAQPEPIAIDEPEPEESVHIETQQPSKSEPVQIKEPDPDFDADDFMRPSAHGTPAITDDGAGMFEDSIESMFAMDESTNDNMNNDDTQNFAFDSVFPPDPPDDLNNPTANSSSQARPTSQQQNLHQQQPPSFGSILPGLEQYANMQNQPDDLMSGQNSFMNNNNSNNNTNLFTSEANIFDEMLADTGLDMGDNEDGDFGDINIDSSQNLDFDELFGS